jgi:hypothetical protein
MSKLKSSSNYQHINKFAHQITSTPKYQHISTSKYQHIKKLAHRNNFQIFKSNLSQHNICLENLYCNGEQDDSEEFTDNK